MVRIKGGYKVINKRTGKTIHTYIGPAAYSKAKAIVKKGY